MTATDPRSTWNKLSSEYQSRRNNSTESAHYGPWAPTENELRLLGDVHGKRVLEVGCGGGQCAVAFARQGARVAAIDISDAQLAYAQALAYSDGVAVDFIRGSADDLGAFETAAWDVVYSTYVLQYVDNLARCISECSRVLAPGGLLVFSLDHPFRDCFVDEDEDALSIYPTRSYFNDEALRWRWNEGNTLVMRTNHYTIAQWIGMLLENGLRLQRLLEPEPPAELLDALWPVEDALAALRHLPQTIIFVAEKS